MTQTKQTSAARPATTQTLNAETPLLDKVLEATLAQMDQFAVRAANEIRGASRLKKAAISGNAIKLLKNAITGPMLDMVKGLMNTHTGFLTDRDPSRVRNGAQFTPYDDETIKTCIVEAMLHEVMLDGNEFNIIAGKCYITQNGYKRKCRELPGLTDLQVSPGIPRLDQASGQMVCRVAATWKMNGKPMVLMGADGQPGRAFPIKNDSPSTADNLTGKALRKAYKAVFELSTGSEISEVDEDDTPQVPKQDKSLLEKMKEQAPSNGNGTHEAEPVTKDDGEIVDETPENMDDPALLNDARASVNAMRAEKKVAISWLCDRVRKQLGECPEAIGDFTIEQCHAADEILSKV